MSARLILVGTLVLLGTMFAGGCVSAEKYNEAVAANDRMSAELAKCQEDLNAMRAERDRLREQLAAMDNSGDKAMIASLEAERDALKKALADLEAKLAAMGELEPAPMAVALPEDLDAELLKLVEQNPDLMEYDRARGMVKFKTDLLFDKGSDEVSASAKAALQKFAAIIKDTPSAGKFHVYIAGHTDDIPIKRPETLRKHPTNWYLSAHRAVAVEEVLQGAGLPPQRLGVLGFSEFHPVAPNAAGGRGNAQNRRVEIWIVPPAKFLTTDMAAK